MSETPTSNTPTATVKPAVDFSKIGGFMNLREGDVVSYSAEDIKAIRRAQLLSHAVAFVGGVGTGVVGTLVYQEVSARRAAADATNVAPMRQTAANR